MKNGVKAGDFPSVYVRIKDFQSAEDVELEIRGFTCVTGKTNIGKSAIIRAMASALQNSPVVGDVRKGSKFCSVTLRSADWGFRWEKSEKGGGTYYFDNSDKILGKIGQGQVEDIIQIGFGSVHIGDDNTQPWFASQFEPVFLLNKSGPAVTDFISGVSRLNVLQDAIILSLRGKKRALDEVKLKEDTLEKLRVREAMLNGLDSLLKLGQEIKEQAQSIGEYETKIALIEEIYKTILHAKIRLEILNPVSSLHSLKAPTPERLSRIQAMHSHLVQCESAAQKIISLRGISKIPLSMPPTIEANKYGKIKKHEVIYELKNSVDVLKGIDRIGVPLSNIDPAMKKMRVGIELQHKIRIASKSVEILSKPVPKVHVPPDPERLIRATKLWNTISGLQSEIGCLEQDHKDHIRQLEDINNELAQIPSCSACGRPVAASHSHIRSKPA